MYILKESENIFQDMLLPFSVRQNERFFYQIIGVPDNETEYYNNLYQLECNLRQLNPVSYYRYDLEIKNGNMTNLIDTIRNAFKFKDITQKDFVFTKCFDSCGVTSKISSDLVKNWRKTFCSICNKWYSEKCVKKTITFDMIVSFGVKISKWLSHIIDNVYQCVNILEIPKVIFYGCEKEHEMYFMELLFNLGFDVLYINTKEIQNLTCKNKLNSISKKIEYEKKCELPEFPKKEQIVSYETNALKAQNEVNEMYYDGQSVLKPWQLQKCSTRNVPLKITYDELFTLWNVDSNMRPQFKVQNNTVYIPNLCCKVSGVEDDVKDFCNKIIVLFSEKNCVLYENKSPVSHIDFEHEKTFILRSNLREMLDHDFKLDRKKMKNAPCWSYGYLNPNLQEMLLDHVERILKDGINQNNQKEMIQRLIVILNLDSKILNLLQNFDYGFSVPKLILYHSTNMQYYEIDAILFSFLNSIGFDIVAITPTRYCDLEDIFEEEKLNIFHLGNSAMNLKSPFKKGKEKKSFIERIFD